jgi:hypothetical protein
MADYKLVTIIGIHSRETFPTSAEVEEVWSKLVANRDLVAAALFRGGHTAPLSGQEFVVDRVHARPSPAAKKQPRSKTNG